MKNFASFLYFFGVAFLVALLQGACSSDESEDEPLQPGANLSSEALGKLSDHFQFYNAPKMDGQSPSAPASGSSLKFNIKDTLQLVEGMDIPVQFLHDNVTNVAGAYVQLIGSSFGSTGGNFASYHYDVPELSNLEENDTVSTIIFRFDPDDLELPLSFTIKITPYDESGMPLDETALPVKVDEVNNNPAGVCGLVNPPGEYWSWEQSYIPEVGGKKFYNAPGIIFDNTQDIRGCCEDGISNSGASCVLGNPATERTLKFLSYYQESAQSLEIHADGTFDGMSSKTVANPNPEESNFCAGGEGEVDVRVTTNIYRGNWTVKDIYVPGVFNATEPFLRLTMTSASEPFSPTDPGGVLFSIECSILIVVWPDYENNGDDLFKYYRRTRADNSLWYQFH